MNKDNKTHKKIIDVAIKEFLEKGFSEASLRNIAKKAGVTTGAFYRYYASKEELFDFLVGEHASQILTLYSTAVDELEQLSALQQTENMAEYSQRVTNELIDYIYEHFDNIKLLICSSGGTKYDDFIHRLVAIEEKATFKYIEEMNKSGINIPEIDCKLVHMISSGLFDGIFEIVRHDMSKEEAKKFMKQIFLFYTGGWSTIMNIDFINKVK